MVDRIVVVETPRDAFQGLKKIIPVGEKINYILSLLSAGFKHIDLGSFVSPKAVPQMADTEKVVRIFHDLSGLERIAIVANLEGLERALNVGGLDSIGFPFSLSQQFQIQNTKTTTTQTLALVEQLLEKVEHNDMSLILYLSMAFGNPYGDSWDEDSLLRTIQRLAMMGVRHISLADTVGVAQPKQVESVFRRVYAEHPEIQFSAHFHGRMDHWYDVVEAALGAGCRRFDATAGGLGGCPFAHDLLVGNTPSELLVKRLHAAGYVTGVDEAAAEECAKQARVLHQQYAK